MDLQSYIDHYRHPFGSAMRMYQDPPYGLDLERTPVEVPSAQAVSAALLKAGCSSATLCAEKDVVGTLEDGHTIRAHRTPSGWLITGGPAGLLSYGAPDASALERFPACLESVLAHARTLKSR